VKSTLNVFLGVWVVFFALFLPFTYSFFPGFGVDLTNELSDVSEWVASSIFGVEIYSSPTTSDSAAQFVQALILLLFAFPMTFLLKKQKRFSELQIKQFLHTSAAYILSFFLLKYGIDKLFQYQFYAPEPNTLFTPLGMLSKDILFWSSMGTSSSYNTFMGLIEVIPALLLLHHRTRMLGAFIALGVLVNVLMINFSFDITVKLLSMYLVIVSLFVLSPFFKRLIAFFITDKQIEKPQLQLAIQPKVRGILKTLVVVLLFTEVLYGYAERGSFNGREMKKIEHFGSYELVNERATVFGVSNIKRMHIHSKGYLILENENGEFIDFPIRIAEDQSIIVYELNTRIQVMYSGAVIIFKYPFNGETQSITTEKYNLNDLPANDDSFHWTVDEMVGDTKN